MTAISHTKIKELLVPETAVERQIIKDPEWTEGVYWGKPRYGHPEGPVLYHIREVLNNVDKLEVEELTRSRLRFISMIHDTFKHKEHRGSPRDWSRHHAVLARQFAERYTDDQEILDIIELHDEAYYSWRLEYRYQMEEEAKNRLDSLLSRLNGSRQLYYLFFKCDTQTGNKNQAPMKWFEETIEGIDLVDF